MKPRKLQKEVRNYSDITKYSSMAFQMMAIIALGVFGGIKIDKWLHLKFPFFTIVLSLIAVILAIYYFVRDITFISHKDHDPKNN